MAKIVLIRLDLDQDPQHCIQEKKIVGDLEMLLLVIVFLRSAAVCFY